MATNQKYARKSDYEKSNLWSLSTRGSVGVGPVGVQLFHLVNRTTHRGHHFELITVGEGVSIVIFTGSIGSSDYVSFHTPMPVNFFDFDQMVMRVAEVNAGLYSWTAIELPSWGVKISISDGGLGVPSAGDGMGIINILFGNGQILGQVNDLHINTNYKDYPGPKRLREVSNDDAITYMLPGDLLFATDKYNLKPGKRTEEALERIGNQMKHPTDDFRFLIIGHTDNIGTPNYNLQLSKKRAETVASWFKKSIKPEWIKTVGMGLEEPIESNETDNGRATNRRVEVVVIRKKYWESW